jgi:hypothetical protein
MDSISAYRRDRFPAKIIRHGMWLHLWTVPAWQGRATVTSIKLIDDF